MKTQEEIQAKVTEIVADMLGMPKDSVKMESGFVGNLGADSLDLIELTMALEDEFGLEISDEDAEKLVTVQNAVDYVFERIKAKG